MWQWWELGAVIAVCKAVGVVREVCNKAVGAVRLVGAVGALESVALLWELYYY